MLMSTRIWRILELDDMLNTEMKEIFKATYLKRTIAEVGKTTLLLNYDFQTYKVIYYLRPDIIVGDKGTNSCHITDVVSHAN